MTKAQVVGILRKRIGKGTAKDFAAQIGVSPVYLSDVLHGRRDPGPAILQAIGVKPAYVLDPENKSTKVSC